MNLFINTHKKWFSDAFDIDTVSDKYYVKFGKEIVNRKGQNGLSLL